MRADGDTSVLQEEGRGGRWARVPGQCGGRGRRVAGQSATAFAFSAFLPPTSTFWLPIFDAFRWLANQLCLFLCLYFAFSLLLFFLLFFLLFLFFFLFFLFFYLYFLYFLFFL